MSGQALSLVTGGCGFIGKHLVQALIRRGHPPRVLDISPEPEEFQGKVDVWTGSILDRDFVHNAMQGVATVYHLAAIPHLWSSNPRDFQQINVNGTKVVLDVAKHVGVKKFVYTSSETVLRGWKDRSDQLINESHPIPSLNELAGPYSKSKWSAERKVKQAIQEGLPGLVVYPTIPIGPGDTNLTPPTRMIRDFLSGSNPAFMECNLNLIPVQAVAEGQIAAAEQGVVGERYILGQTNYKMSDLLVLIEQLLGKKMPKRKVPYQVALTTARFMEWSAKLTKKMPPASIEGVRLAAANMHFDCTKAQNELNLPQYSVQQALIDTGKWLKQQGYLQR
jgi:dihydroflavonol-4-reductase